MKFNVKDALGIVLPIELHPWSFIKDVKDQLTERLHIPAPHQRLFYSGRELKNTHTLNDCGVVEDCTIYLAPSSSSPSPLDDRSLISVYGDVDCSAGMADCINQVRQGLSSGLAPRLAMEGTGGTYFLRSRGKVNVAVFKAEDEEPFAPANPRGYQGVMGGAGFRHGLVSGEGAVREVAAFLIDHSGFAGVPPTTRVEISKRAFPSPATGNVKRLSNGLSLFANPSAFSASISCENLTAPRATSAAADPTTSSTTAMETKTKVGSLQAYVEYDELAGDVAPQSFPASEVHKIAILDIRLFNIDRNEANILVQRRYPPPPPSSERSGSQEDSRAVGRAPLLFSLPSVGPSHLHHHHSGFSPENPFSFSPHISPVHSSRSFFDSPTLGSASVTPTLLPTPLSPDFASSMQLPPAATSLSASFNLNYPMRAHSFEQRKDSINPRPTASIPIPIPIPDPTLRSSIPLHLSSTSDSSLLSSSVPTQPSRLQARLQTLKTMRAQAAPIKPTIHLIPIDHSYTLPDTLELATVDWCWMDWPQAKLPLSPEAVDYVLKLDIKADIELLRSKLAIREECLKVMRISGLLLQKGVAAGLTLYDIASLICRANIDKPSHLEVLCAQATTLARGIKDNVKRRESTVEGKKSRRTSDRDAVKSVPTSPAAVTESDSSDNADSPPQSADFSSPSQTETAGGSLIPSSSLTRMLQLHRGGQHKEPDECKVDDEDSDACSVLSTSPFIPRSPIPDLSLSSPLHQSLPQPIPSSSTRPSFSPSLTRSNSLDLILRRSISYDDFRGVKVAKAGFNMSSITTAVVEHSEEEDGSEEGDSASGDAHQHHTHHKFSSPPTSKLHRGGVDAYKADNVYHHAGGERKVVWSREEQSQLFFSCLSGLMDSALERVKAQKTEKTETQ